MTNSEPLPRPHRSDRVPAAVVTGTGLRTVAAALGFVLPVLLGWLGLVSMAFRPPSLTVGASEPTEIQSANDRDVWEASLDQYDAVPLWMQVYPEPGSDLLMSRETLTREKAQDDLRQQIWQRLSEVHTTSPSDTSAIRKGSKIDDVAKSDFIALAIQQTGQLQRVQDFGEPVGERTLYREVTRIDLDTSEVQNAAKKLNRDSVLTVRAGWLGLIVLAAVATLLGLRMWIGDGSGVAKHSPVRALTWGMGVAGILAGLCVLIVAVGF